MKSVLSQILRGLCDGSVDVQQAQAASKVAAQLNAIMRTELDAARLHFEMHAKPNGYALTAIGYAGSEDDQE